MKYTRKFSDDKPFQSVIWETRTAEIKNEGTIVFRQENVEVPKDWSQLATNIVASKYFYGALNTPERETSVRQLIHRVANTIAAWGRLDGYFDAKEDTQAFFDDLVWLLLHQYVSFNSPVWFNVGLHREYGVTTDPCNWYWDKRTNRIKQPQNPYEYPQTAACFLLHVDDNMESIMDLARTQANLFKFGSGSGVNLSTLRASCEGLSGGGHSSGPLSFMRVYDQVAETVASGGKNRRAAQLICLNIDHPDIEQFITCKAEEETHAKILIDRGVSPERAAKSVMYQNMNISVRVTDDFMEAVEQDEEWVTYWITNPNKEGPRYKARDLWRKIAESAHTSGDPGLVYSTTVDKWHTIPKTGPCTTPNACSEVMSIDYSACNLASINLLKFRKDDNTFDHQQFEDTVRIMIIAQDILIDRASYPLKEIANNAHRCRQIGLGYTNLGALLMSLGLPYDSTKARDLCSCITAIMTARAYLTSAELANNLEPFAEWAKNSDAMLAVIDKHADAAYNTVGPLALRATQLWDEVIEKGKNGFRNSQTTLCAPVGTISFLMDCDTTGIEPELALVKIKQLVGGGTLKLVNKSVGDGLRSLGINDIERIETYLHKNETLIGSGLSDDNLKVFATSLGDNPIPWRAHLEMMAAAQPFLSGAISKTVNLPADATIETVEEVYKLGWELGLKSVALYRDQSKGSQPLNVKTKTLVSESGRIKLPDTRQSITHRFEINNHTGYFTVGLYPDGRPGEVFIAMAKEGSTLGGLLDCFGIAISIGLQYGVPLDVFVEKFAHTRFEPSGWTPNPDIHMAKSIIDYIFRWLQKQFGNIDSNEVSIDAPACDQCGSIMLRVGTCYLCPVCGNSGGCS